MKRIGVVSLRSINNAGDEILAETTEYLIKLNQADKYSVKQIEMIPKNVKMNVLKKTAAFVIRLINKYLFKKKNYRLTDIEYQLRYRDYYRKEFSDIDAVITAIGMLKYSTQNHSYIYRIIVEAAEKLNLPVMISAASVQKPNESDWRYKQLKDVMKSSSIKVVTTRDGKDGTDKLKENYLSENVICDFVGDPALWIPECYGIQKKKSVIYGIGLLKKDNFIKYGKQFTPEQLTDFYVRLLKKLDERGIEWKLFSNGMKSDEKFGAEIIRLGNYDSSKMVKKPENARELIDTVSNFRAILGIRLHACLTAFSLGVPLIGLIWEDKLSCFAKTMKLEEYFFSEKEFDENKIVDSIEKLQPDYRDLKNMNIYKNKTKIMIDSFLKDYVK